MKALDKKVADNFNNNKYVVKSAWSNKKYGAMKYSEFRRWLEKHGATFAPGKGSHRKVTLNGKSTVFPDHGAKEIGTGLVAKIKKDLGLK